MSTIKKFEDLQCWQESRVLANFILDICEVEPVSKQFRLRDQLSSAAISVMNNIAEGFGRFSNREFIRFLNFSSSSCLEVRSMGYLLFDRKIIDAPKFEELIHLTNNTNAKILGFVKYLNNHISKK